MAVDCTEDVRKRCHVLDRRSSAKIAGLGRLRDDCYRTDVGAIDPFHRGGGAESCQMSVQSVQLTHFRGWPEY